MQLNVTEVLVIMAASEPPEPPPRNPDKINASLKQTSEMKLAKSLDISDRPNSNNTKSFQSILSLDNNSLTMGTKPNDTNIPVTATLVATNETKPGLATTANTTTTMTTIDTTSNSNKNSPNSEQNCNGKIINKLSSDANRQKDENDCTPNQSNVNDTDNGEIVNEYNENGEIEAQNKESKELNEGDVPNRTNDINNETLPNQKLLTENIRLTNEIDRLKKLLENSLDGAVGGADLSDNADTNVESITAKDIDRLQIELRAAKEQISNLKIERRKLKSEKVDLLAHVKQLCASLQDKEQELRDFIRNFEHRMRETESSNAKMSTERERERWSLLKHAREESERSIALATQLNTRDMQLKRTQEQLLEARCQISGCMSDQESLLSFAPLTPPSGMINHMIGGVPSGYHSAINTSGMIGFTAGDRGSCSADSGVRGSSDRESAAGDLNLSDGACDNGPCITIDSDSISLVSSHYMNQFGTPKERSPTLSPLNASAFARSMDSGSGILSRSVEHLGSPIDSEAGATQSQHYQQPVVTRRISKTNTATLGSRGNRASGGGGTWGSISRVFARSRHRNKNLCVKSEMDETSHYHRQCSPLTEEGYAEKLRLLREASAMPMERWRASQVLAWLEVALGMPQYSTQCSENVKSGKVLLELNDAELESGLGLTHSMHRKKIRLAIEEQRRPEMIRYLTIGKLGHTWVASEWLPDIGLPQYVDAFLHSLVDARMLDTLSKKELEKYLGVTRKFHQASIVHGIHVLRILKYDRQALAMRRLQCENLDIDPIVWNNQKFIRWARSIDLGEYAENLKESGVHGGLVVLEPSFSGDTMATAMGIPTSKNIIRRHLSTEFDSLVLPARATLGQGIRTGGSVVPITGPGGLQSYSTSSNDRRSSGSIRGSLSNVFRFNTSSASKSNRQENKPMGSSTSPTPSYSSQSSESGMYATVGSIVPPALPSTAPPSTLPHQSRHYHIGSDASQMQQHPNHRVSAPPLETNNSTMPRYADHRRVKSINDIEIISATPV